MRLVIVRICVGGRAPPAALPADLVFGGAVGGLEAAGAPRGRRRAAQRALPRRVAQAERRHDLLPLGAVGRGRVEERRRRHRNPQVPLYSPAVSPSREAAAIRLTVDQSCYAARTETYFKSGTRPKIGKDV